MPRRAATDATIRQRVRAATAIALLAICASLAEGATKPAKKSALPFIEDDYAKALAQARAEKLPLFIEAWAPW